MPKSTEIVDQKFRKDWTKAVNNLKKQQAAETSKADQYKKCCQCVWGHQVDVTKIMCPLPRCIQGE